jgi:hypothetical protein
MDRDKVYEKRARLYPVIVTMALPFCLLFYLLMSILSIDYSLVTRVIMSLIPTGIVIAAFSFYLKNIIRSISKWIFQFAFFKEDESYMPTTELLLWNNCKLTDNKKRQIREKIRSDFNVELPTKSTETKNEQQSRKLIAETVPRIREITRGNVILFDYNCYFGSIRNALGGCVVAEVIVVISLIMNLIYLIIPIWTPIIICTLYLFCIILAKPLLNHFGYEYARKLYDVFLSV